MPSFPTSAAGAPSPTAPHTTNTNTNTTTSTSSNPPPRPPLTKRHSSQSQSSQTSKYTGQSPASAGELAPLRHHHKKPSRHAKVVLPRNHSSGRNLAKLARQSQSAVADDAPRHHARAKSHEGDTEIRLPGSLDESTNRPPMRRNLTAQQLSRNTSSAKLKKNLSHSQLTRLNSGKNLQTLLPGSKGPPSPAIKGKSKRPKSAGTGEQEKDLHEQEVEIALEQQRKKQGGKKVGFAVGSAEDSSDEDQMSQDSGNEWTDQSNSASPYSTRQNTANNSRRTSVMDDKVMDKRSSLNPASAAQLPPSATQAEQSHQPPSAVPASAATVQKSPPESDESEDEEEESSIPEMHPTRKREDRPAPPQPPPNFRRTSSSSTREHQNPAAKHMLGRNTSNPAPALVSNISTLDSIHSAQGSPAPSSKSSINGEGQEQDELVSRFMPSASHPNTGSGANTTMNNTPSQGTSLASYSETTHFARHRGGAHSPGSTVSASSGTTTPRTVRSRTEQRMQNEKGLAAIADDHETTQHPTFPNHQYDRRNQSLKSYLNLAAEGETETESSNAVTRPENRSKAKIIMGPEIFQGRFKAVNTELKVVQKFRDPVSESFRRLQACRETKPGRARGARAQQQAARMPISKSSASLARAPASKLSTSTSPPRSASPAHSALASAKSATQLPRRGGNGDAGPSSARVSFGRQPGPGPAEEADAGDEEDEVLGPDTIARQMWDESVS